MTLSEARALCPGLGHAPAEPEKDRRALEALGRWLGRRFSPVVALDPPDGLLLDVTGCDRLFGGIERLVARVAAALTVHGVTARLAVAPTVGAAWALATFGHKDEGRRMKDEAGRRAAASALVSSFILPPSSLPAALADLPTAALRLDAAAVGTLLHLGIETVGQLLALDRPSLLGRLGPGVLLRIDQALGHVPEVLRPLAHRVPVRARMDFDWPVSAVEALWEVLRRLVADVAGQLATIGAGARRVEAEFRPAYAAAVRRTVLLSRPSRAERNLFYLLRCATEQLEVGDDGFVTVVLSVPVHEPVADEQLAIDGTDADGQAGVISAKAAAAEVAGLMEVLSVRLGPAAVLRAEPRASHLPERAYATAAGVTAGERRPEAAETPAKKRRTGRTRARGAVVDPARRPHGRLGVSEPSHPSLNPSFPRLHVEPTWQPLVPDLPPGVDDPEQTDAPRVPGPDDPPAAHAPLAARPLHLLPTPRELRATAAAAEHADDRLPIAFADGHVVHRVAHASGPERVAGPWWEGNGKTRDYYDVETEDGQRFWIFRVAETGRWFAQGTYE